MLHIWVNFILSIEFYTFLTYDYSNFKNVLPILYMDQGTYGNLIILYFLEV